MKATTKATKRSAKRADRSVPFEEMRRLMQVYGSIKCLRKRAQKPGTAKNAKVDSVKRKFYRWFPDLDERFEKDVHGFYTPRFGHEAELRYREGMRKEDGELIAKKRVGGRKKQQQPTGGMGSMIARAVSTEDERVRTQDILAGYARRVSPASAELKLAALPFHDQEVETGIKLELDQEFDNDRMASASIIEDTEPLDSSFIAEEGIFDAVEKSFYNDPPEQACFPRLERYISSSSEEQSSGEESNTFPSIQEIEECCEEMLELQYDNVDMDSYLALM